MAKSKRKNSRRGYSPRKVNTRRIRQRFLIVCEGEKTEPNYFRSFRVPRDVIDLDIHGLGRNPTTVVEKAKKLKDKDGDYDQTWCVFDIDSCTPNDVNQALRIAKKEKIKVAYSNEAFELWYILHFEFLNTGIPRKDYSQKLTNSLGHNYEKNSDTIYDELIDNQETAIKNAKKLLSQYQPPNPYKDNPSTTVYLLVEELNKFIK